jgi:hypothetical protein
MMLRIPFVPVALVTLSLLVPTTALANHRPATVFVTHGIPGANGFPVDISVSGPGGIRACLPAVTFTTVAGPWSVPPGTYTVAISPANRRACSAAPVLGPVDIPFEAGEDAAIVAHLTAAGQPTAGKYAVDLRPAGFGKARVNVFHLAAAPAVDISVTRGDRTALELTDVENGDSAAAGFRPGAYEVSIAPAGDPTPVFGPVSLRLRPFVAYLVFAIGSLGDGSFTLATGQTWVRWR